MSKRNITQRDCDYLIDYIKSIIEEYINTNENICKPSYTYKKKELEVRIDENFTRFISENTKERIRKSILGSKKWNEINSAFLNLEREVKDFAKKYNVTPDSYMSNSDIYSIFIKKDESMEDFKVDVIKKTSDSQCSFYCKLLRDKLSHLKRIFTSTDSELKKLYLENEETSLLNLKKRKEKEIDKAKQEINSLISSIKRELELSWGTNILRR